ncbi:MAG: radical SAM protein [Candidatus Cloacimonetes bacterium]|nr:radical SAM protein [Candidatus Cloacimonadota bacterium]
MAYQHLFGPVPSRRLGVSLGVDLVPYKVCSQNCIYCEVGKTTNLTIKRREYVNIHSVIEELEHFLSGNPELDFITFSGAGEPTLNSGLGKLIKYLKKYFPQFKIALITNSNLLTEAKLQDEIQDIDVLLPSLDAASDEVFQILNRPCRELNIKQIIDGIITTRKKLKGKMWLEIFLSPGINDTPEELEKLQEACQRINPHLIQLNTLDRPGVIPELQALPVDRMEQIRNYFLPLPVEVISKAVIRKQQKSYNLDIASSIIETIKRRPSTDKDLCQILGLHINELNKYLSSLLAENLISKRDGTRGTYFEVNQ